MEERSTSAPEAAGDNSPGQGPQTGLVAAGRPGPGVPVDNSGVRPTFPGRRERTRSRLARLTGRSTATYSPILEPLLRTVRANNPKEDFDLIQRAFVVAEQSHRGQKRKSGDPYITHPVAVATILAELGLSGTTLAAALLHDTVEDTPYTLADLKADFGPEVAMLVDGVTKLDKVSFGEAAQSETVRKMVVAMAKDIRVLMIKLADRLHNARTWRFVSAESSARKARETLEIFAPLAHRLGMNTIKWELEDLSFAALYPKVYEEIVRMVGDRTPEREKSLERHPEPDRRGPSRGPDQGHHYRPAQALLLDLPEDDRPGQGLRRHQRPHGRARPGGLGPRLLCGARHPAFALEPPSGAVQGLHRHAQVQHVPVAAHHGDRPGRQARGDPDPHA